MVRQFFYKITYFKFAWRYFLFLFMGFFINQIQGESVLLDLETAWQRILCYSPSVRAAEADICVHQAEAEQVSFLLNPVGLIEAENLGISHPNEDDEAPQTTIGISQTIELGGKRCARRELALELTSVAYWDAQIERLNKKLELRLAFIELAAAQERLKLAQERVHISEKILEIVDLQVCHGKVSSLQRKKAKMALMTSEITYKEALSSLEIAKKTLALLWGSLCPDFDGVLFDLCDCAFLPCPCCVADGLYQIPDFIKARLLISSAAKNLSLQRANRIPDLTVNIGYRMFSDSNQSAWVVGAAIPIPIFNRNQGNIKKAHCEMDKAEYECEEVERDLKESIGLMYEKMALSFEKCEALRTGLLIEAIETFQLTQSGYEKGKFDYMELLEAQQLLFDIQENYSSLLYDYQCARAELSRLTGRYDNL